MSAVVDRCTQRSGAAHEPLAGTASTVRRWLLVEHAGPWGHEGLVDARLPEGLGLALRAVSRRTRSRILLIRRPVRVRGEIGTACFAVDTADAWIGARTITSVEEAAELDPRDRRSFPEPVSEPVVVVCTHGRRDICCAERGRPLAAATARAHPRAVWESTHVGGDRFAANMVTFPHGLVFGRVEPEGGAAIVSAYTRGLIELDGYRGRTSHPMPAQAAEVALRRRLGLAGIDDVALLDVQRHGDIVAVRLTSPGAVARVTVRRDELEPMRLTCSSAAEEAPTTWSVDTIELEGRPQRGTSSSS